jgi:hypothetical protein
MGWAQTALGERTFRRMGSDGRRLVKVASCRSRSRLFGDGYATGRRRAVGCASHGPVLWSQGDCGATSVVWKSPVRRAEVAYASSQSDQTVA